MIVLRVSTSSGVSRIRLEDSAQRPASMRMLQKAVAAKVSLACAPDNIELSLRRDFKEMLGTGALRRDLGVESGSDIYARFRESAGDISLMQHRSHENVRNENFVNAEPHDASKLLSWRQYLSRIGWSASSSRSVAFELQRTDLAPMRLTKGRPINVPAPISFPAQVYTHIDKVEFVDLNVFERFLLPWKNSGGRVQRAGLLYGRYEVFEGDREMIIIEAIYEPPQRQGEGDGDGVRLLHDSYEGQVERIADAAGLERVGWVFTHLPRNLELTSSEVHLAARFQNAHIRADPLSGLRRSQFVTMSITKNVAGEVVPRVFMATDTAMVIERNDLLDLSETRELCCLRKPRQNEIMPSTVDGDSFHPMRLALRLPCSPSDSASPLFLHNDFPVANRHTPVTIEDARSYLRHFEGEALEQRISDFHLLLFLPQVCGIDLPVRIAQTIACREMQDQYVYNMIHAIVTRHT